MLSSARRSPEADRYIRRRVVADLLERSVKKILDLDPQYDHPDNMRGITKQRDRGLATHESDQDPPELVDAGDRGARVGDRGRLRLEGRPHRQRGKIELVQVAA
jgi:hypothetical protein